MSAGPAAVPSPDRASDYRPVVFLAPDMSAFDAYQCMLDGSWPQTVTARHADHGWADLLLGGVGDDELVVIEIGDES